MDQESPSTETSTRRTLLTPVNVLLAAIAVLLVVVIGLLVRGGGSSSSSENSGNSSSSSRTAWVEEGGFRYTQPSTLVTAKWGEAANLPDGLTVRASNWEPLRQAAGSTDVAFRYQVEYTNASDKALSTEHARYRALVNDGTIRPCSQVTGPPDKIPPSGTVQPGETISGWVGAGCPAGTKADAAASLEIRQHSELSTAVVFVP